MTHEVADTYSTESATDGYYVKTVKSVTHQAKHSNLSGILIKSKTDLSTRHMPATCHFTGLTMKY